jgi:hypothetical protein
MKNYLLLFILTFFFSCTDKETLPLSGVNIRIQNTSQSRFDDVFVNTSGGEHNYGTVLPGRTSSYSKFNSAYNYAYIKLSINGQDFVMQPIDYVGESLLPDGNYTYILSLSSLNSRLLELQFRKD